MSIIDELKAMGFESVTNFRYTDNGSIETYLSKEDFCLEIAFKSSSNVNIYVSVKDESVCDFWICTGHEDGTQIENIKTVVQIKKLIEALKGE